MSEKNINILGNGPVKRIFVREAWFYKTTHQCEGHFWCWFWILSKNMKKHDKLYCWSWIKNCITNIWLFPKNLKHPGKNWFFQNWPHGYLRRSTPLDNYFYFILYNLNGCLVFLGQIHHLKCRLALCSKLEFNLNGLSHPIVLCLLDKLFLNVWVVY